MAGNKKSQQWKGFVEGGIAAVVAGTSTHPLDLIKVRMQLIGESAVTSTSASAYPAKNAPFHRSLGSFTAPQSVETGLPAAVRHGLLPAGVTAAPRLAFAQGASLALAPEVTPRLAAASAVPTGPLAVATQIMRTQGVSGLFNGASASAMRQLVYSSTRMGVYDMLKRSMERREALHSVGQQPPSLPAHKKVAAAILAGAIGAAVGNPADLAMVRMQADGRLPVEQRRNYRGVGDALQRIVREEGVVGLWRGCGPTVYRAMAVTAGQFAVYDQAKETLIHHHILKDGVAAHITSAIIAAVAASLASNPFDVLKTRLMNMRPDPTTGLPPYSGTLDCALKTVRSEGLLALYKGLGPTIARQGPFALILFVTLEQVRKVFAHL